MNKKIILATTVAIASMAQAAGLSWHGASDIAGRVDSQWGADEESSGWWYLFTEGFDYDSGSSKMFFPADVEEDEFYNFFGPLTQKYGGLRTKVVFGDIEKPYAGFGFTLVNGNLNNNLKGANLSENTKEVCIAYQSTQDFAIELVAENEKELTKGNNYSATVEKSSTLTQVKIPWSKFKQDASKDGAVNQEDVLKSVAIINILFTGTAKTEGEYYITAFGTDDNCIGGPGNTNPTSDINKPVEYREINSEPVASDTAVTDTVKGEPVFWNGKQDCDGRVLTKLGDGSDTEGYWFSYADSDNKGGLSEIHFPNDVREDGNGNFYGPLIESHGGILATIELNESKDVTYPYAGFGFNITGIEQTAADITSWGGVCLAYKSKLKFQVKVTPEDAPNIGYESAVAPVPAVDTLTYINIPWSKFRCASGWGCPHTAEDFISKAASVRLHFTDTSSVKGDFFLQQFGSLDQCGPDKIMPITNKVITSKSKALLNGRELSFQGMSTASKVSVIDLRGKVVASANVSAGQSMNLSHLKAGVYMVRISGENSAVKSGSAVQKITLK